MLFPAIIRVHDRLALAALDMIEQQGKSGSAAWRLHRLQGKEIIPIERNDVIETVEILGRDLPSPHRGDIDAVACGHGNRPPVRRTAHMPVSGSGGIYVDIQSGLGSSSAHRRFGERRATDVAEANEQDGECHEALSTPQAIRAPLLPDGSVR